MVIGFKLWLYFVQHRHELSGGPVTPWDAFVGLFKGYEEAVFVPLWKLKDVADYHERASVHTRVHRIARPLLVVHSRDDPVVPGASSSLFLYIYIYIYTYQVNPNPNTMHVSMWQNGLPSMEWTESIDLARPTKLTVRTPIGGIRVDALLCHSPYK